MDFITQLFCDLSIRDSILVLLFLGIAYLLGLLTSWLRRNKSTHTTEHTYSASTNWEAEISRLKNDLSLKDKELKAQMNEANSLRASISNMKTEKTNIVAAAKLSTETTTDGSDWEAKMKASQYEIDSLKGKLQDTWNANEKMKADLRLAEEKANKYALDASEKVALQAKYDENAGELVSWKLKYDEQLAAYNKLRQDAEKAQPVVMAAAAPSVDTSLLDREIADLKAKLEASKGESTLLQDKLNASNTELAKLKISTEATTEATSSKTTDLSAELTALTAKYDEKLKDVTAMQSKLVNSQSEIEDLKKQLADQNLKLGATTSNDTELAGLKTQIASLNTDLGAKAGTIQSLEAEIARLKAAAIPVAAPIVLDLPKGMKLDDLKVVEGIGPKIESILQDAGVKTWKQLSETTPDRISEILLAVDEKFRIHDPKSWPIQAGLLAVGKWEEFNKLTEELKGGRMPE